MIIELNIDIVKEKIEKISSGNYKSSSIPIYRMVKLR